jgi:hypothetical protein
MPYCLVVLAFGCGERRRRRRGGRRGRRRGRRRGGVPRQINCTPRVPDASLKRTRPMLRIFLLEAVLKVIGCELDAILRQKI